MIKDQIINRVYDKNEWNVKLNTVQWSRLEVRENRNVQKKLT